MKILDVIEDGDKLRFVTDNVSRPEFVYKADMFGDLNVFKKEIEKSILFENKKKEKFKVKVDKVKTDFKKEKPVIKEPIETTTTKEEVI